MTDPKRPRRETLASPERVAFYASHQHLTEPEKTRVTMQASARRAHARRRNAHRKVLERLRRLRLSVGDRLLFSLRRAVMESGERAGRARIAILAWQDWPTVFGLGSNRHPDSHAVYTALDDLVASGLVAMDEGCYRVTNAGAVRLADAVDDPMQRAATRPAKTPKTRARPATVPAAPAVAEVPPPKPIVAEVFVRPLAPRRSA